MKCLQGLALAEGPQKAALLSFQGLIKFGACPVSCVIGWGGCLSMCSIAVLAGALALETLGTLGEGGQCDSTPPLKQLEQGPSWTRTLPKPGPLQNQSQSWIRDLSRPGSLLNQGPSQTRAPTKPVRVPDLCASSINISGPL